MPGQGNNVYIFPAMGMAVFATEATRVSQEMFIVAAKAVAEQVSEESLATGLIYPPQSRILEASLHVANGSPSISLISNSPECRGRTTSRRISALALIGLSTACELSRPRSRQKKQAAPFFSKRCRWNWRMLF